MPHIPVLLKEVIDILDVKLGQTVIDATLGAGGHTEALLSAVGKQGKLIAIDVDKEAVQTFNETHKEKNVHAVQSNFLDIDKVFSAKGVDQADAILFDLGLSSDQLDNPRRGFSFQKTGPLDMRLNQGTSEKRAYDIINGYLEKDLEKLIRVYGEEVNARRIAHAIAVTRKQTPLKNTRELFELIKQALPAKVRFKAGDVARRTFQALRIEVNKELEILEKVLPEAFKLLRPGGRMAVISFHSLEDKIVKKYFQSLSKGCLCPPQFPVCICGHKAEAAILTPKVIRASLLEEQQNPRSKSAKLRAIRKLKKE